MTSPENSLFRPGRVGLERFNACVGNNGGPYDFGDYAYGYFKAGEIIAQKLSDEPNDLSAVVHPLVFIYRHAIELSLKSLSHQLHELWLKLGHPLDEHSVKQNSGHGIQPLWNKSVKPRLESLYPQSAALISEVDRIIQAFEQIDSNSQTFRYPYPKDKSADLHLKELYLINIAEFLAAMVDVEDAFMDWIEDIQKKLSSD